MANMKQLVCVIDSKKEGQKGFWTRIGTAFENKDGSWALRFDYFPCDLSHANVQMRDIKPREERGSYTPPQEPEKPVVTDDNIPF